MNWARINIVKTLANGETTVGQCTVGESDYINCVHLFAADAGIVNSDPQFYAGEMLFQVGTIDLSTESLTINAIGNFDKPTATVKTNVQLEVKNLDNNESYNFTVLQMNTTEFPWQGD